MIDVSPRLAASVVALLAVPIMACAGEDGAAGDSCAVADNGDGTSTITCEDGTSTTVANGEDGSPGSDGSSCTVTDNGDGTKTIACGDTEVVVEDGVDSSSAPALTYVGMDECESCHEEIYEKVTHSGHPYKLNYVGGMAPDDLPNASMLDYGNFPASPPDGYAWSDISYIIGGWGWKARFLDLEGYVITCENGDVDGDGDGMCDTTASDFDGQWNLVDSSWTGYHRGEFQKEYSCGPCHTTGYDPDTPTEGMPGIVGSFSEPGVRCEACHGPGSAHVDAPRTYAMEVDRSAEMCGSCHIRGSVTSIPAKGGFIRHHEQWNEMFVSQHQALDCVDCHDPHESARFTFSGINPTRSIRAQCESCHFNEAANQASTAMAGILDCIDCHMPRISKSAVGNAAAYSGDVRTHLFAINVDADAPQFNTGGDASMPYVSLDWACRSCHRAPGEDAEGRTASEQTDSALEALATGYHER